MVLAVEDTLVSFLGAEDGHQWSCRAYVLKLDQVRRQNSACLRRLMFGTAALALEVGAVDPEVPQCSSRQRTPQGYHVGCQMAHVAGENWISELQSMRGQKVYARQIAP